MKTTWDELMRYAPEQEIPLPPMQDGEGARILSKTMGKIKETKRKPARPVRTVLIAAAIAALLCGSAFAAHSFGWFDRLFGEKAALVKDHVTSYDEATSTDITQPTYTEEEQAMIAEGTMQVPDTADLADTGVSAETDDFTFTLESMLVSRNSFYAIMRIDAKNDDAAAELAAVRSIDGEPIAPARVRLLRKGKETAELSVTIHEGKNRQIRRMCAAVGLHVKRLRRVREHTLSLGALPEGGWRELTADEVRAFEQEK